jgi:ribose transport system substrate-binding protein
MTPLAGFDRALLLPGVDMKRSLLLAAAVLLAAAPGCDSGGQAAPGETGAAGRRTFGVTYQTINNPFFAELTKGLEAVIQERGDKLVVYDAGFNAQVQNQQVSDLIQARTDAIFLNPVNWRGIGRSLEQAKQAGIPVVVIDAPAEDEALALATVASDNLQAGRLAGEALKKARPDGSRVAILALSVNKACRDRVAGFKEALAGSERYPIARELELGQGNAEAAYPLMRDMILSVPDLGALFAINDPSAFGALRALEQAGKVEQVVVLAVDGNKKALEEIEKGRMLGTSAQFPRRIGEEAARTLYRHLEGKPVEKAIKTPVEFIDRANLEAYRSLAY